jgi:chromosome segregation ATPase
MAGRRKRGSEDGGVALEGSVLPPAIESAPPTSPLLSDLVTEIRQALQECQTVREHLGTLRQGFVEVTGELEDVRNRAREARQKLGETEGSLHELKEGVAAAQQPLAEVREVLAR